MTSRTAVFATLAMAAALACAPSAGADDYQVTFSQGRTDDDGALRRADVVASLTPDADGRLRLNRIGAETGLYHHWAQFILQFEASDQRGQLLSVVYEPHGVWRLEDWDGGPVQARYSVLLQHDRFPNEPGDDELAAATPFGVMWTGRALFIEGAPSDDVDVAFFAPEDWRVTSPWRSMDSDALRFQPTNTDDLLDAAFFAGMHLERVVELNGVTAHIATGPDMTAEADLFSDVLQLYAAEYAELFDAPIAQPPVIIALPGSFWGGGVIGRSISMTLAGELNDAFAPMARHVVAHEAFHLWNVAWRIEPDARAALEWFLEGGAEYFTVRTGARLGTVIEEELYEHITRHLAAYEDARVSATIAEAGRTKLENQASYDLVYSGGFAAALALDLRIRRESEGAYALDDVLRYVHGRYAGDGADSLDLAGLAQATEETTGLDLAAFFDAYIEGGDAIPALEELASVGLCARAASASDIDACDDLTPVQSAARASWIGAPDEH